MHRIGRERLRDVGRLNHGRARADQFREASGQRTVGAELGPLEIVDRLQRRLGVDALTGPGHRIEQPQTAPAQHFLEIGFLRLIELERIVIAGGDERQIVRGKHRILVAELTEQELADIHLAGGHRAQDVRMLDQRLPAVNDDLELPAARLLDLVGELADVLRVKLVVDIRRRHIPFRLRPHALRSKARTRPTQELQRSEAWRYSLRDGACGMVATTHAFVNLIGRILADAKFGGERVCVQSLAARKGRRDASELVGALRGDGDDAAALLKIVHA